MLLSVCQKRILETRSLSMQRKCRQFEKLFVIDYTRNCQNDIGAEKDEFDQIPAILFLLISIPST